MLVIATVLIGHAAPVQFEGRVDDETRIGIRSEWSGGGPFIRDDYERLLASPGEPPAADAASAVGVEPGAAEGGAAVTAGPGDGGEPARSPETGNANGPGFSVQLTFYNCRGQGGGYCGAMSSGASVYEGAAACGYAMALGTRFAIEGDYTGRVYTCEDRGLGPVYWIDVFFWDYASGRAWRNTLPGEVTVRLQ